MSFPISPANGSTTLVNGINYVYSSTTNSWTRVVASLGNLTIAGNINAERVYTTTGLFWAGNNQQVVGDGINMTVGTSPPGGYIKVGDQWYATDIGVLFEYLDDGDSQQWVDITSAAIAANSVINLTAGDFSILGHITPGLNTVYDLGNVSYKWRDVYVGGTAILGNAASSSGYFWANGTPAFYSNSAVAQYLPNYTGNVAAGNVTVSGKITTTSGLFWANGVSAIGPIYGNTQVAQYLPNYTGNVTADNIIATGNVTSANITTGIIFATGNITSANLTTGIIFATGNTTVSGNLNVGNYANIVITTGAETNRSALTILGNVYGRGGVGYLDAIQLTNNYSAGTNPNKYLRVGPAGTFEIINSAYTTNLFNLTDAGALSVPGPFSISGKKAVNGPAFSAYANATLQTITSGSQQKVLFQTEEFDTDGCYASSTFTPTVEGYYQLNAEVRLDGATGTGECMIILWKNGAEYKRGWNSQGTQFASNFWAMTVSSLAYANGTTDYFEIYVQQGSGGSVTVTAVNNTAITWFNGAMVRGA